MTECDWIGIGSVSIRNAHWPRVISPEVLHFFVFVRFVPKSDAETLNQLTAMSIFSFVWIGLLSQHARGGKHKTNCEACKELQKGIEAGLENEKGTLT